MMKKKDKLIKLLKEPIDETIPLGFQLLRPLGASGKLQVYTTGKSTTHQSEHYGVGGYYKPIAMLNLEEEGGDE